MNKYPPCNGDCEHCARPASKCHGGGYKSPYVDGTQPRRKPYKSGDFGAVKLIEPTGVFNYKHP